MLLYQLVEAQKTAEVSNTHIVRTKDGDKLENTYLIIKHLILLLHTRHKRILRQRIRTAAILPIGSFNLHLQRLHIRRQ